VLTPEQFSRLDEKQREQTEKRQAELQEELRDTLHQLQDIQEEVNEAVRQLDQEVVGYAVSHLINRVMRRYADLEAVIQFLQNVRNDLLENVETFKKARDMEDTQERLPFLALANGNKPDFDRYRVNLLVDNSESRGAPVIYESNPTYLNLLGRVEYQARLGALVTNFQMIKSGALHRANGGYLIVNARDILMKPLAWEGLKRALKDREVRIESMSESLGAISTRSLDPEPIPLDIKVIVTGDPMVYYMLYSLDQDLRELFKVRADFATQMDWTNEALQDYARFIGTVCKQGNLLPFAPSGVAKVIEQSSRMVSHQKKLATTFRDVVDLIHQSSYWAGKNGNQAVRADDVRKAVTEQIYRASQLEEHLREMIQDETILIDTDGEAVGQVNGISVLLMGDYSFGKPSRITARSSAGRAGVINIEREIALGGRIHNKGILIISGYVGGRYAQEIPLTFSTSITFEQSYEEVEGDSAASAELYALLSSLAGYPIRQDLAVTGSVNQHGQVQAIGGVNEKIEGFFEVCKLKGLTGKQGVLIPQSNVKNLMLREDLVEAIRDGKFHVYPIATIDEGIELLTGIDAGERNEQGEYPANTVNHAVQARLRDWAEKVQSFARDGNHRDPAREKEISL
jgi:lon-related putative ATP-dependent protease